MDILYNKIRGLIECDKPLAELTWVKTGGCADMYFEPADLDDLKTFLKICPNDIFTFNDNGINRHIDGSNLIFLGGGSNVLISDSGISGVVIHLGRSLGEIKFLEKDNSKLYVGAGALTVAVSNFAVKEGLLGLEFLSTIPGNFAGAVKGNAGCFGGDISDIVEYVKVLDRNGEERNLYATDCMFQYRSSGINGLIVSAIIRHGGKGDSDEIFAKVREQRERRNLSQPMGEKTFGSTFKNPSGVSGFTEVAPSAAKLIEEAGLKGFSIGGAMVSTKHSNFLVNTGDAITQDFIDLIAHIKAVVYEKFSIQLLEEVKFL